MKKFERLSLYGWPALAVIILFSLFAGLLLSPGIKKAPDRLLSNPSKAAAVRYLITDNREPLSSEETTEIRALYAADLFASSRASRFSALSFATNRLNQTNIVPVTTPLFLPFAPASNGANTLLASINPPNADNAGEDLPLFAHAAKQPIQRKQKNHNFSVEFKGNLNRCSIGPDFFQGISSARPAGRNTWLFQAQIRINREGRVDHLFAESTDCEPPVYQEIVKRLYNWHFSNVTETCEGTIIICCP